MVCRRSLLKKCRGVDIRAAHGPRVASAVDSRSDTRAGKQAGNRTADTPGAGGWPSAKMPAAPKERQQWAVRGPLTDRRRSTRGVVRTLARGAAGSRHGDQPIPATMLAVRWASVARGLSG